MMERKSRAEQSAPVKSAEKKGVRTSNSGRNLECKRSLCDDRCSGVETGNSLHYAIVHFLRSITRNGLL